MRIAQVMTVVVVSTFTLAARAEDKHEIKLKFEAVVGKTVAVNSSGKTPARRDCLMMKTSPTNHGRIRARNGVFIDRASP